MNIFVSGGCKNGKSFYAQRIAKKMALKKGLPLYYVATMIPRDNEDRMRIARHIDDRRGWGFQTIEQPVSLLKICSRGDVNLEGVFLLDSVTAIMENEMFPRQSHIVDGERIVEVSFDPDAAFRVKRDMLNFARATGNTVFVSDGIYGDGGEYSQSTEEYRRGLAEADRALAEVCERVVEISYGFEEIWK